MALTAMKLEKHKCNIVCLDGRVIHSDVTVSLFFHSEVLIPYATENEYDDRFIFILLVELVQLITGQCLHFIPPENTRKLRVFRGYETSKDWSEIGLQNWPHFEGQFWAFTRHGYVYVNVGFWETSDKLQTKIMYLYTGCTMVLYLSAF